MLAKENCVMVFPSSPPHHQFLRSGGPGVTGQDAVEAVGAGLECASGVASSWRSAKVTAWMKKSKIAMWRSAQGVSVKLHEHACCRQYPMMLLAWHILVILDLLINHD